MLRSIKRKFSSHLKTIPIHKAKQPLDTGKLHLINQELHHQLGPIYSERLGPDVDAVWISDPLMAEVLLRNDPKYPIHVVPQCWQLFNQKYNVKRGLFFLDGPDWHDMRKKMNPIFLKKYGYQQGFEHAKKVSDSLISLLLEHDEIKDIESKLHQWSVESTLAALYGSAYLETKSPAILSFVHMVHQMFDKSAILQTQSAQEAFEKDTLDWQEFCLAAHGSLEFLHEHFSELSQSSDGMIVQLMKYFSADVVSRIVNDLIIAAADTTSYTTLWTLYLLACHPEYQKDLNAKGASKESMRLFPVAPFLTRIQQVSMQLEGYQIKEGQLVLISLYSMGRHPNYFENPDQFMPERWTRTNNKLTGVVHPFASLPFSFGARSCIGKKLAELQMEYFLKELFAKCRLKCTNDDVQMTMRLIGLPDQPLRFERKPLP